MLQTDVSVALCTLQLLPALVRNRLLFYRRFDTVNNSTDLTTDALDWHVLRGLSFHGAVIVQATICGGCAQLLSEDMQHVASFGGVCTVNPFA